MAQSEIVSKVPEVTPELLAANEEEQKQWRKQFRYTPTSADSYANNVIRDNLNILDTLERQLRETKNVLERTVIRSRIAQFRDDTAIWLASVGQFEQAGKLTTSQANRELYKAYAKAVKLADDAWCEHPPFEHIDGNLSQIAYREMEFFSDRHGRKVSMVRCSRCDFRNARELDADLKKLSDHRAAAVASGKDEPKTLKEVIDG